VRAVLGDRPSDGRPVDELVLGKVAAAMIAAHPLRIAHYRGQWEQFIIRNGLAVGIRTSAAIRGVIEGDKFPHAPRLDPLRAALARLEAVSSGNSFNSVPPPKAPPPAKADKRARREL
jgi:hypothetical protein